MITAHAIRFLDLFATLQRQLTTVIAIIIFCFGVVAWQYKKTHFADPLQPVLEVHPRVFQLASHITVGMHINNFPEFSFRKNEFTLDALVVFIPCWNGSVAYHQAV